MAKKILGIATALVILASTHLAGAQPIKAYRIGFLSVASSSPLLPRVEAFRLGLRELGYVEGQNITIHYRWAEGKEERLPGLVAELLRLKVDVIVTHGIVPTLAVRQASTRIPIVCAACGNAVATGLVASLARPGGNITGLTIIAPEVSGKRLELLREIVPRLTRVAVLRNPGNPVSGLESRETEAAARTLGLQLQSRDVREPEGFASAFSMIKRERADALIVLSDAMFFGRRRQIADLAAANGLPTICLDGRVRGVRRPYRLRAERRRDVRRAPIYVDKILKGANPGDLPFEQPTKFELIVNLKTARTLGLAIPQSLLLRADSVVE